jgi:hypothetical protein
MGQRYLQRKKASFSHWAPRSAQEVEALGWKKPVLGEQRVEQLDPVAQFHGCQYVVV